MHARHAAVVLWSLLLCACGGGGGGDSGGGPGGPMVPTASDDGLGSTGQIAGARPVSGNTTVFAPTIALDDSNRGLIIWSDYDRNAPAQPDTFYSARSDANGNWQAPQTLPVGPQPEVANGVIPVLRSDSQGHAVVNFRPGLQPNLMRFDPDTGWFAIPAPLVDSGTTQIFGEHSDPLLADGTLPILVTGTTTSPSDPFATRGTVKVLTQRNTENFNMRYETPEFDGVRVDRVATLAVIAQSRADLYFNVSADAQSPTGNSIQVDSLDLQGNGLLPAAASPVFFPASGRCRAMKFASSESSSRVAQLPQLAADNATCQLVLARFASPSDLPTFQLVTADGFSLGFDDGSRFLGVDSRGNALAVWRETPTANLGTGVGARLMWSQSVAGGPWSTPQLLLDDAAGFGQPLLARFAMNRNGQAVAVVTTLQFARTYLTTARFSFESGWSFTRTANLLDSNARFDVAINSQGAALAAYVQLPCNRRPLAGGGVELNCDVARDKAKIFAVQF